MSTLPNTPVNVAAPSERQLGLDARTPLLLLPVNLETRFMVSGESHELWARIYPDQIAINSHEPELTTQEIADGTSYWNAVWSAGVPPATLDEVQAPWRGLASLYGAQRAAWIALQMTPTNLAAQPTAPTAAGVTPSPAPIYPSPPTRASSWQQPAKAALLPDLWTVVLVKGTSSSSFKTAAVNQDLAVGLTPGAGAFPPGSPVDTGLQWLVDFDLAVAAGMALRIPLTPTQYAAGFDQIIVYGLRSSGTAADLASLIDSHHYTDGFAFVPQGMPTNNTSDASSAYSSKDPNFATSFAVEREGELNTDPASDAAVFAWWLGLDAATFAHIQYAGEFDRRNAADAVTALWPSTLGYFLSQMMASVFSADVIETARQYVLNNTSARGPLPAIRTGTTPYGVLPVTSLKRYNLAQLRAAPPPSIEAPVVDFIERLWPVWLSSSAGAPHMQSSGDPDAQLVSVLGMDASSMTFRGRTIFGEDFLWNYLNFIRTPSATQQSWWNTFLSPGRQELNAFGYNAWDPRLIDLGLSPSSFPISLPTVTSAPLSETDPLAADANLGGGGMGNYIQWLVQASIDDIRSENYPGPLPTSLLYKILRQSMLLDYVTLAATSEIDAGRLTASQLFETEIIGIPTAEPSPQPPVGPWDLLTRPSVFNPAMTWADYLLTVDPPPQSPLSRLADLRASMGRMAQLPTAELDRLLTEFLDACSHRLDVWASTIANALLARTRASQITGLHIGSFGWIEQVVPAQPPPAIAGTELTAVRQMDSLRAQRIKSTATLSIPNQPPVDNGGYIFAPSFEQARTAAILRSGYMTHQGTSDEAALAIDISSDRVRKALYLLDGVRQGQSLNALLGYLFEDGLHDLNLDKYTQPFRDRFPVVANKLTPSSDPTESVAASNVVDGVALCAAFAAGQFTAGGDWGPGLPAGPDQTSVLSLIETINDDDNALADLSVAESVFQIVRGNFGRAGGLLDAVSQGERPPDPDIVATPRGGLDLTHRVALLFAGSPSVASAWSGITQHPRAQSEPWLDAWLSQQLPDPVQVVCTVTYTSGSAAQTATVHLRDLDVGPLDCLALSGAATVPQQSELESRIFAFALPAGATGAQINYTPPAGAVAFPDFFFLASQLQSLIGAARALTPQDLTLPENKAADLGGTVNLTDLTTRASTLLSQLTAAATTLQSAATGPAGPLRSALLGASFFGVPGSVPSSASNSGLAAQATSVLTTLQSRLTQANKVNLATASESDVVSIFTTVFGQSFPVLPLFTPPDLASLQQAFAQSADLVSADPTAPARWLNQLTHIRPAISRLDLALSLSQILQRVQAATPLLGQLPFTASDRWLGLPIDPANPPAKGRVALVCFSHGDPATQPPTAGLLIDEWPERIPSTAEKAAVAFHYAKPRARAPQALLLAVCPDDRAYWDDDLITGVLEETLELAKIRTVDLNSVLQVGQLLPALYFALNLQGATVSVNFTLEEVAVRDT